MAAHSHLSALLSFPQRPKLNSSTGLPQIDALAGGVPVGAITEIFGSASSGRTSLLMTLLAAATGEGRVCALVDASDSFHPASAAETGVRLHNLVWVRCRQDVAKAFKAADLLLHGGGFGIVALDLGDLTPRMLQRVPLSYWYRFRRAVEDTSTSLVVLSPEPQAKSCAALLLEATKKKVHLSGAQGFQLLRGVELEFMPRKPVRQQNANLRAEAPAVRLG